MSDVAPDLRKDAGGGLRESSRLPPILDQTVLISDIFPLPSAASSLLAVAERNRWQCRWSLVGEGRPPRQHAIVNGTRDGIAFAAQWAKTPDGDWSAKRRYLGLASGRRVSWARQVDAKTLRRILTTTGETQDGRGGR